MSTQRLELQAGQHQALLLTFSMRQSIHALELPLEELNQWLEDELDLNPAFERPEEGTIPFFPELPAPSTLFQTLMNQARLELDREDLEIAEWIIGNLDHSGFYTQQVSERERPVLEKIQQLGPPGIAAEDLRHCLLLQLKENTLSFRLVRDHFDDLLHNRLKTIVQKVGCSLSTLKKVVKKEILRLNFRPASLFSSAPTPLLLPDLVVDKREDQWVITIVEPRMPEMHFSQNELDQSLYLRYVQMGKGLIQAVERRKLTLKRVAELLIEKMADFFEGKLSYPSPLTIKEVAAELGLAESTVARAVSSKAIQCVHGVLPLRSFFTQSIQKIDGQLISNSRVKQRLLELVQTENKETPLCDETLSATLKSEGILCARRTVTKYRKALKIPSASQRKKWRLSGASEGNDRP